VNVAGSIFEDATRIACSLNDAVAFVIPKGLRAKRMKAQAKGQQHNGDCCDQWGRARGD